MPLISTKPLLQAARREGYAVGAFNPVDYNSMRAMVRAAEECDAPVIVQASVKTVKYWGHHALANWMRDLAGDSPVPVAFHLDHCHDVDFIASCLKAGWTSVMIDASSFPFEQNLAMSRQVVEMASARGAGVEAELGQIVGIEEDMIAQDADAHLTDPDQAVAFCKDLDLAAFAPAIGSVHGYYKGEPNVAFDRIDQISQRTGVPLALHGGTGLPDETIQRCIQAGCAKVNISTQLKHAFIDGVVDYHNDKPDDYEPLRVIDAQYERMKREIATRIIQFGGAGQARAAKASAS